MRKIAISDIHGCALSFETLLDNIALSTADELYLLGDYIDRGPDSKKTLDMILDLQMKGYQVRCLAGNHDFALIDARTNTSFFQTWFEVWGGEQTMDSFGIHDLGKVPDKYWKFLDELELFLEVDQYILVHAGLDFTNHNPLRPDISMLYIRNWYDQIKYEWLGERIIVHGHTPVTRSAIIGMNKDLDRDQVIDIDGGCFAKHLPDKGYLCAFDLTNRELFFQKNLDDVSSYWMSR